MASRLSGVHMQTLAEIGAKYGTDKTTRFAGCDKSYLDIYEKLLSCFDQRKTVRILEIGVRNGASVNMFLERFPNANVVGLDIEDCVFEPYDAERYSFVKGDQSNESLLQKVAQQHGMFDLILDDGSHCVEDYKASFHVLYKFVTQNGFYVIEDLYNNYKQWNSTKSTRVNGDGEAFDEFNRSLIRKTHLSCAFDLGAIDTKVFSISHYPGVMVITKELL